MWQWRVSLSARYVRLTQMMDQAWPITDPFHGVCSINSCAIVMSHAFQFRPGFYVSQSWRTSYLSRLHASSSRGTDKAPHNNSMNVPYIRRSKQMGTGAFQQNHPHPHTHNPTCCMAEADWQCIVPFLCLTWTCRALWWQAQCSPAPTGHSWPFGLWFFPALLHVCLEDVRQSIPRHHKGDHGVGAGILPLVFQDHAYSLWMAYASRPHPHPTRSPSQNPKLAALNFTCYET